MLQLAHSKLRTYDGIQGPTSDTIPHTRCVHMKLDIWENIYNIASGGRISKNLVALESLSSRLPHASMEKRDNGDLGVEE